MNQPVDPSEGQRVSMRASSGEEGAHHELGPTLWDFVGRPIAAIEGFEFSEALEPRKGEVWSYANLDKYLAAPDAFAPGTNYPGIENASVRAHIIAFLRSLSDDPEPRQGDTGPGT